ncbi:MAG: hypothetical protein U5K54_18895 [Cytophagales bacterium]|nr:hypothetical protein [Cytophagales bacterium]
MKSQEDLAILYWKKGDMVKAESGYKIAMDKSLNFINRYFPPMSEAEKTKYWDALHPRFQRFYNYCLEASGTNPAVAQTMYNYQIGHKRSSFKLRPTKSRKQFLQAAIMI